MDMQLICLIGAIIDLTPARPAVPRDFVSVDRNPCVLLSWHSDGPGASIDGEYWLIALRVAAVDRAFGKRVRRVCGKWHNDCEKNN
jgi:hypothetical protein